MRRALVSSLLLTGCLVESGKEVPLVTGDGAVAVDPKTQKITLDTSQIPVLPTCAPNEIVRRGADGTSWTCAPLTWTNVGSKPPVESDIASLGMRMTAAEGDIDTHTHVAANVTDFATAARTAIAGAPIPGDITVTGRVRQGQGNMWVNADLALGAFGYASGGAYPVYVFTRTVMTEAGGPIASNKFMRVQISTLGPSGDVLPIRFPIFLETNTDYYVSCYARTTAANPVKGVINVELHNADWTARVDLNIAMGYANDGQWHRVGGTFNTGVKPLADIYLRSFDTLGTWDITGCQLTKGSTEKPFSSDRTDYPCPDPDSVSKYGFCIFHAYASYGLDYKSAADLCRSIGTRLCTLAEVGAAQASGAEWCSWGWVADRSNDTTGYRAFPMQQVGGAGQCCDKIGVCVISTAMTANAGANCCR